MPAYLAYPVLAVNLLTFAAFGLDKWKARTGRRRIRESTLLLGSWATGLLGGWVAMAVFAHKTSKTSFRVKMVLVSVLNPLWPLLWWAWAD